MERGWEVEYSDGLTINEDQADWGEIPKTNMVRLSLRFCGREWNLVGKDAYFQKKRASMIPGVPESFQVESRTIGYYEGQNKVMYTVDEFTGRMKMEVKEIK